MRAFILSVSSSKVAHSCFDFRDHTQKDPEEDPFRGKSNGEKYMKINFEKVESHQENVRSGRRSGQAKCNSPLTSSSQEHLSRRYDFASSDILGSFRIKNKVIA